MALDKFKPMADTNLKYNVHFFTKAVKRKASKNDKKLKSAKSNVALFSRHFIACDNVKGIWNRFLHIKTRYILSPSMSEDGDVHPAKGKLDSIVQEAFPVDVKLFVLVNMLQPTNCLT